MKYIVVLIDGMADRPLEELGGKTPMAYAQTPNMDKLARYGRMGMVNTIPHGFAPGSDVANLSVLGYDPARYYTGRASLEAANIGADLGPQDVAFRCNLVTLSDEEDYLQKQMVDYSSDEISTQEARAFLEAIDKELGDEEINFYVGTSYRHLMVWKNGPADIDLTPPHDISDKIIGDYLPVGPRAEKLRELMMRSSRILLSHPDAKKRRDKGLNPPTSVWFWGHGTRPSFKTFREKYDISGAVISAVDLVKGIGIYAGLRVIEVEGATGTINTNFTGKAMAAVKALREGQDFVFVHMEAADEAGHRGEVETKVKAIEEADKNVIGVLLSELRDLDYRIAILPDHATPISIRTHSSEAVPFLIVDRADMENEDKGGTGFSEESAKKSGFVVEKGHEFMDLFLNGSRW